MDDNSPSFGPYLSRLRQETGLERKELAQAMGTRRTGAGAAKSYSADAIRKWEADDNRPQDYATVVRLADALGLAKFSERRATLFWLAGEWIERAERLEGLPGANCRRLHGRTELFDAVEAHLRQSRTVQPVVLLAAFGGYGKTEFARYLSERLVATGDFRDAAWIGLKHEEFHATLGVISPIAPDFAPSRTEVLRRLMHRLSCRSEEELRARLGGEPLLVVLDNLETLPPAERETAVGDLHRLLGDGPSRAIVTSRFDLIPSYVHKPAFEGLSLAATGALLRDEAHHQPRAVELRSISAAIVKRIWELTRGMPLALHMVVGQSQHYGLAQVIATLERARAEGSDEAFYHFLCRRAWDELGDPARALLVFIATATRAPQTSAQLLDVTLFPGLRFDAPTLGRTLAELSRWFLLEPHQQPEWPEVAPDPAYDLHPVTRAFVLQGEIRERWQQTLDEARIRAAATRKHEELLARARVTEIT